MRIEEFDYNLPEGLIAQKPVDKRDESRLLVVHRDKNSDGSWADINIEHRHFFDILDYLKEGDCLVLNDSKVIPARLFGVKAVKDGNNKLPGAKAQFLLIKRVNGTPEGYDPEGGDLWEVLVRPGKRLKPGDDVIFSGPGSDHPGGPSVKAHILDYGPDRTRIVQFSYDGIFMERLEEIGSLPLPPYIDRLADDDDKDRYQTVYCREEGSVAAPTAGLHFTEELLEKVKAKGVELAYVTLHVGIGTFRPVKVETVEEHHMHFEEYSVSREAAEKINRAKREGRRVISVGTTSTRTLESAAYFNEAAVNADGTKGCWQVREGADSTGIFIYPGYEWKMVEALITNFHLPKSTLLMLISSLYDREKILEIYKQAVEEEYRFFSYGDAMFIE